YTYCGYYRVIGIVCCCISCYITCSTCSKAYIGCACPVISNGPTCCRAAEADSGSWCTVKIGRASCRIGVWCRVVCYGKGCCSTGTSIHCCCYTYCGYYRVIGIICCCIGCYITCSTCSKAYIGCACPIISNGPTCCRAAEADSGSWCTV